MSVCHHVQPRRQLRGHSSMGEDVDLLQNCKLPQLKERRTNVLTRLTRIGAGFEAGVTATMDFSKSGGKAAEHGSAGSSGKSGRQNGRLPAKRAAVRSQLTRVNTKNEHTS